MSGWLALFRTDGGPVDPTLVERGMRQLRARGPHGEAVVLEGCAALGLTVLDTGETVPSAREPVRHASLLVTGHARIDARDEVGRMLGVSPAELSALTDLALLARAFERYGVDVPARVFGEYAACVWDAAERRLTVVRDAFGVRPAYVAHVGGWAIASNTLDAVRVHPAVSERLDDEAILEYLLLDWIVGPGRTPFLDVRMAPPGGSFTVTPDAARARTAWTLRMPEVDRTRSWRELALRYRDALDLAVADRLRGAQASIALSGGIDSISIGASAARGGVDHLYATTDVMTDVASGRDDEGDWATIAASHLGIRHRCFDIGKPPAERPYAWCPLQTSTPYGFALDIDDNGSWASMAAHGAVLLNGEGGDEIWRTTEMTGLVFGEPWPSLMRGVITTLLHGRRPAMGLNIRGRLRGTRRRPRPPPWLSDDLTRQFDLDEVIRVALAQMSPSFPGPRGGSEKALKTALWPCTLAEYDAHAAVHALDFRLPLLDQRVVAAALVVPPLPGVVDKLAARHALAGRLPAALVTRRKTPAADAPDRRKLRPTWAALPATQRLPYYVDVARLQHDAAMHGTSWEVLRAVSLWRWLGGGAQRPGDGAGQDRAE